MGNKENKFIEKLYKKRQNEILNSAAYKYYSYIKTRYFAKKTTSKNNLVNLKNSFYKKYGQTWTILKYSRICDPSDIPFYIPITTYITEQSFRLHLDTLSRTTNVIPLDTLINYLRNNDQPPLGSIVITIDEGYNSAYYKALPALLDFEIPATFSIPTAYIGNKVLMWDTLIENFVKILLDNKIVYSEFPSLPKDLNDLLEGTYNEDKLPGSTTLESMIYLFLSLKPNERMLFFQDIESILRENSLNLPTWQDFMDWEQLLDLRKANYSIISKLHTALPSNFLKIKELEKEIELSMAMFQSYELPIPTTVSLPFDVYNRNTLDTLAGLNITHALGGEDAPDYFKQNSSCKLLKRKSLLDGNTNQEDLFLLNLYS